MPAIWSRVDGRKPQEHRRREFYAHNCHTADDTNEIDALLGSSHVQTSRSTSSGNTLMMASDVRISYAQGATSLIISIFGPTTSKRESAFEKAEVVLRLHSRVGVLAVQPLSAVGSAPEKRRFLEARHQQLQEVYAAVLLPLLQTSVESVLCLEQFPRCVIAVDVIVLSEDGGLFATVLNGVMCALLEAGLPCRSSFGAITIAALTANESSSPQDESQKVLPTADRTRKRGRDENSNSTSSLCFFVDPSSLEETLCGVPSKSASTSSSPGEPEKKSSVAAAKEAALATTARGQLIKMQQECCTVAVGTFVMGYRPTGGSSSAETRYPTIASHIQSGPGSARTTSSLLEGTGNVKPSAILLKPHEWITMERLACMSVTPVFDFYRKLNVPLEES